MLGSVFQFGDYSDEDFEELIQKVASLLEDKSNHSEKFARPGFPAQNFSRQIFIYVHLFVPIFARSLLFS
jgi:ABC-type bacteriocin/lantibiotic exporter with double-glycine peptidase domain